MFSCFLHKLISTHALAGKTRRKKKMNHQILKSNRFLLVFVAGKSRVEMIKVEECAAGEETISRDFITLDGLRDAPYRAIEYCDRQASSSL